MLQFSQNFMNKIFQITLTVLIFDCQTFLTTENAILLALDGDIVPANKVSFETVRRIFPPSFQERGDADAK